jgi:hypothetical protein
VTVNPPVNTSGFTLSAAASGLDGSIGGGTLIVEGKTNNALVGVSVDTGSTDGTILRDVTIQDFQHEGILLSNAAVLGIKEGVSVLSNGTGLTKRPGLRVSGSSHANIVVGNGLAKTSFDNNGQHGIFVTGTGYVFIQGVASSGGGTIECVGNEVAGLAIAQTPGNNLPLNTVNGLYVSGTTIGNGMRIEGGSNVNVRNSTSLGNAASGVLVTASVVGITRNNSVANIVLGNGANPGNNVFQADAGPNANQGAGICLRLDQGSGTLLARGNFFSNNAACATAASVLTFNAKACNNGNDLGLAPLIGTTKGNDIDVTLCTHP